MAQQISRRMGRHRGFVALVASAIVGTTLFAFAVLPASAGTGPDSARGVTPAEVALGGQPNDCDAVVAGRLPADAAHELRIENPQDGVTYSAGVGSITLAISNNDKILDFTTSANIAVFDVVVKGGQKSTHFDYDGNGGPGGVHADEGLHAPTKGGGQNLFNISHVSFCYDTDFSTVGGTVFIDDNGNGTYESTTESPDAGREVTAYDTSGPDHVVTSSAADGSYDFILLNSSGANTGDYTICEDVNVDLIQTAPAAPTAVDCASFGSLGQHEALGHGIDDLATDDDTLDFGNAPEVCGETLTNTGAVFDATFVIFEEGNNESGCENKTGSISETAGTLELPLNGPAGSQVAGIGTITKTFPGGPGTFVPLEYSQGPLDPNGFQVLPWCGIRDKVGADGDQFDPYLADDTKYPSLAGVFDPTTTDPSVACKVAENETAEGHQLTVVLIQDDPFWQ